MGFYWVTVTKLHRLKQNSNLKWVLEFALFSF